jgi:hypothetical protein
MGPRRLAIELTLALGNFHHRLVERCGRLGRWRPLRRSPSAGELFDPAIECLKAIVHFVPLTMVALTAAFLSAAFLVVLRMGAVATGRGIRVGIRVWLRGRFGAVVRGPDDHGIEPFANRHSGKTRGLLRGFPRFLTDAFHVPWNARCHARIHMSDNEEREPMLPCRTKAG